ncbi:TPA: GatB/YqeY domain-containing protein [Candidatus Dojkabacteria bacterium]|uniref:GatB/YqeY domain-containing protein n=1 Tax=Candidatus Dojkabacteria bacterium TaxID=2099670 RepID=A0A832R8G9_9BACT|nr:GatB/YqeY domain-containing protein [Candidatus Dojkabacteria bacterium]
MSLLETLRKDMILATKEKNVSKMDILKMALATLRNEEIAQGKELTDQEVEKVLRKEVKKIEESIEQFGQMGREDLVKKEKEQLGYLEEYLPELMSEKEVEKIVKGKIEEVGAQGMSDMGKVMGVVMKEISGKADGNLVKQIVQKHLQ